MRKLSLVLAVTFLLSCGGEQGPSGPQGPPGPAGKAYEVEVDFSESNNYTAFSEFPDIEVLSTDVVMVYLLWEVDQNTGNDVWQPLPVSVFFNDGELQYAFDHTLADVKLFLTGDTDLSTVGDEYTQDQIFRIAILPVDYVQSNKINLHNMNEVMDVVGRENIRQLEME